MPTTRRNAPTRSAPSSHSSRHCPISGDGPSPPTPCSPSAPWPTISSVVVPTTCSPPSGTSQPSWRTSACCSTRSCLVPRPERRTHRQRHPPPRARQGALPRARTLPTCGPQPSQGHQNTAQSSKNTTPNHQNRASLTSQTLWTPAEIRYEMRTNLPCPRTPPRRRCRASPTERWTTGWKAATLAWECS